MKSAMVIREGGRCNGDGDGKIHVIQRRNEIEMKMAPGHGQEALFRTRPWWWRWGGWAPPGLLWQALSNYHIIISFIKYTEHDI